MLPSMQSSVQMQNVGFFTAALHGITNFADKGAQHPQRQGHIRTLPYAANDARKGRLRLWQPRCCPVHLLPPQIQGKS